jgi:hypothetical protein
LKEIELVIHSLTSERNPREIKFVMKCYFSCTINKILQKTEVIKMMEVADVVIELFHRDCTFAEMGDFLLEEHWNSEEKEFFCKEN